MFADLSPRELTWAEVDPGRHRFDSASATDVVNSLEPARHLPFPRPDGDVLHPPLRTWLDDTAALWTEAMSRALADHHGRWALGWRWARGEGDVDGGPIASWCCPSHSMTDPDTTLANVAAGLCEWREWLEQLSEWFEASPLNPETVADQRVLWHRTARALITQVVDRTECLSGWYDHCELVLTWFLQRWEVAPAVAQDLVDAAIGGRFASWTAPDPVLVDDVAERLACSLPPAAVSSAGVAPDHLQRWLDVRDQVPWEQRRYEGGPPRARPPRDGATEDIRGFDMAIDPARGRRLLTALELARADAARDAPLDFELLRGWQQQVLGVPRPPFRTQPAYAKGGRERYGIGPDTADRFDACLAQSAVDGDRSLPLAARAARAYLDVCFFHPFDDGNARSAFLTVVFVLARERIVLRSVGLLRRVSVHADDPQDAARWCVGAIEVLIAGT